VEQRLIDVRAYLIAIECKNSLLGGGVNHFGEFLSFFLFPLFYAQAWAMSQRRLITHACAYFYARAQGPTGDLLRLF
jgi:hypothetical protein